MDEPVKKRIETIFNDADELHNSLDTAKEMGLNNHRDIEVYKMGIKAVYNEIFGEKR